MTKRIDRAREGYYVTALLWEQINRMFEDKQLPLFMRFDDWNMEEKRVHPRIPCLLLLDYATHDCVYRDFMKDISVGGAFIESRKLPTGPEITLVFSFFEDDNPFKIRGEVAWISEGGIGVKFKPGR